MTTKQEKLNQEITDDVLPPKLDEAAVPIELNQVQPWHKPRKQYIREKQWIYFSRRLISSEKGLSELTARGDSKPEVRYLMLPGIDFLDARVLATLCAEYGCDLTTTGFMDGGEGNPHVARAKVREESLIERGLITKDSHLFSEPIQIIHQNAPIYNDLRRKGPYHIINIDACGSLAKPSQTDSNRLIDAIHRIVEFQLDSKSRPWLLFLTTDARSNSLDIDVLRKFESRIAENANENGNFRDILLSTFSGSAIDVQSTVEKMFSSQGKMFLKSFSLGFAKWMIHLVKNKGWNVKTHSTFCYSTNYKGKQHEPTIVSLAFEFVPPPPTLVDPMMVSRAKPATGKNLEDTSVRAANKVSEMEDLDDKMESFPTLRNEMVETTKELLKEAGYKEEVLQEIDG